jgi:hypothetical protein
VSADGTKASFVEDFTTQQAVPPGFDGLARVGTRLYVGNGVDIVLVPLDVSVQTAIQTNVMLTGPVEHWNIVNAAALGTINIDVATAGTWLYTQPATGSFFLNIRGDSTSTLSSKLSIGDTITVAFLNTSGATPYIPSGLSIDGVAVALIKWLDGLPLVSGTANSIDIYSYTITKTAATTYMVLANQVRYA